MDRLSQKTAKKERLGPESLFFDHPAETGKPGGSDDWRHGFAWKGKRECLRLARRPPEGTLRPRMEESRDWDATGNLYIEGDNLEVLKHLRRDYLRSIKMVYIDPPYNTGNVYVYRDDFSDPAAKGGKAAGRGFGAGPALPGRHHDNWLSMMCPRLMLARTLLRDDGVIFISIDDREVHNLRNLCDELFGENNFVGCLPRLTSAQRPAQERFFSTTHDYVMVYANDKAAAGEFAHIVDRSHLDKAVRDANGLYVKGDTSPILASSTQGYAAGGDYDFEYNGKTYAPVDSRGERRRWLWTRPRMEAAAKLGILVETPTSLRVRNYIDKEFARGANALADKDPRLSLTSRDFMGARYANIHGTNELSELGLTGCFDFAKPVALIEALIRLAADGDAVVLDFFSGSATTAHAVMRLNAQDGGRRRYICVQIPEPVAPGGKAAKAGFQTISDIGKERVRRAGDKVMAAWRKGRTGKAGNPPPQDACAPPPDIGFKVYTLDSTP